MYSTDRRVKNDVYLLHDADATTFSDGSLLEGQEKQQGTKNISWLHWCKAWLQELKCYVVLELGYF
jgi:hypothetical protein